MRSLAVARVLVGAVLLLAACSSPAQPSSSRSTPAAAASTKATTPTEPVGLIALGHSGLTGENSGGPPEQNSWATGMNPAIQSIYQRMVALWPQTAGHVANAAQGGASVEQLVGQAHTAMATVPTPALAIIQTIDSDIQCDGTDGTHVHEFGASLHEALKAVTDASPKTQVLLVTQPGTPAQELQAMARLIATNPAVRALYTGDPPCGLLDNNGKVISADVATLTSIVASYQAEQARVCAEFPTCQTDRGADPANLHIPTLVADDYNHLNVAGQAKTAAREWPFARAALVKATSR